MTATTEKGVILHDGVEIYPPTEIRYEKEDDRKRKRYAGKAVLHFEIEKLSDRAREAVFRHLDTELKATVERLAKTLAATVTDRDRYYAGTHDASSYWSQRNKNQHRVDVRVVLSQVVDRPKEIPGTVVAVLCGKEQVAIDEVVAAIKSALDKTKADLDQETRRRDAERLARHLATEAHQKARGIVRFEQRLAALEAELKIEREVQLKALIEETKAEGEVKDDSGHVFDPRAVEAAFKHAEEVFPSIHRSFLPGLEDRGFIKKEEV